MSTTNARNRGSITHAVAAQIRAERAASGLTQREVMDLSGLAKSTYLRMESGERVADVGQLAAFCAAVEVPVSVLMARAEDRLKPSVSRGPVEHLTSQIEDPDVRAAVEEADAKVAERRRKGHPNG